MPRGNGSHQFWTRGFRIPIGARFMCICCRVFLCHHSVHHMNTIWLVVLTILKNISQWEGLSHMLWEKHVPNHQPAIHELHNYVILHVSLRLVLPIYKISKPPICVFGKEELVYRWIQSREEWGRLLHRLLHCHHICKPMRQNELERVRTDFCKYIHIFSKALQRNVWTV